MTHVAGLWIWGIALAIASPLLAGELKVVAFGDSTTAPRQVEGAALAVYADLLRAELPARGVTGQVVNKGVGGHTTQDGMARFERDVLAEKPDLVIIQFGINDSTVNVWKTPPEAEPPVSLKQYTDNLTAMVRKLKAQHARVILMTPNPMRWTPDLLGYYGKKPYIPADPMGLNVTMRPYVEAVRTVAAAEKVELVDVFNLFIDYGEVKGRKIDDLLLDGMHPSAAGHRLVADALKEAIAPQSSRRSRTENQ
jgi:lysophospholipase L1-like esterase